MKITFDTPSIDIELTNSCQSSCLMCPRKDVQSRGIGMMSNATFNAVIESVQAVNIKYFIFCGIGEPLLHSNIFNYITIIKNQIQDARVLLITNGQLLTEDIIKRLIDLHVDDIMVSIQAIKPDLYAELMPGLDYNTVMNNLKKLAEIAPEWMNIRIHYIFHKLNHKDMQNAKAYLSRYAKVIMTPIQSRGGHIKNEMLIEPFNSIKRSRCNLFETNFFITWDGKILPCCNDVAGKNEIGDINNITLEEIKQKKLEIINAGNLFPICQYCNDICAD